MIGLTVFHNVQHLKGKTIPKTKKNASTVVNRFSDLTGGPEHGVLVGRTPVKNGRTIITFVGRGVDKSIPYEIPMDVNFIKSYPSTNPSKYPPIIELLPKDPIDLNGNRKTNNLSAKEIIERNAIKTINQHNKDYRDVIEQSVHLIDSDRFLDKKLTDISILKKAAQEQAEEEKPKR